MASTFTGVPVVQLDDNFVNGRTYTFQFKCNNWFCLSNLSNTIANDISVAAPDFLTSVQVTSPSLTSLYNVQFTYEGDGSDVVSDVANAIQAAVQATSNDNLVFVGGVQSSAADIVVTPVVATQAATQAVTNAASTVAMDATKPITDAVNAALKGLTPLLIVVVVLILFVLPSLVGSYSKVAPRVSVGG